MQYEPGIIKNVLFEYRAVYQREGQTIIAQVCDHVVALRIARLLPGAVVRRSRWEWNGWIIRIQLRPH